MAPSNKDRLQSRIRARRTSMGVAFPPGTTVRRTTPSRVSRPAPGSLGPREGRSTAEVMNVESDPRPSRTPQAARPYLGSVERDVPTEKERWQAAHVRLKQRQSEAASDIARGVKPVAADVKPRLDPEKYEAREAKRSARAAVAERSRRVTATGRTRNRPAGQVEVRGVDIKDSPKGAKAFKGIVSAEGLGSVSTPEKTSRRAWHGTFGATAPFSGRYPNKPETVARIPKVRPKAKPSWGGRTGAASIFAEPLAFAVAGGIKSKSFGGVLDGLKAWKEKYMPSKSSGPLM